LKKLEKYKVDFLSSLNPKIDVCYAVEVEKLERRLEMLENAIKTHKHSLYEYAVTPENTPDYELYKVIETV
jgi:hypothetical protein